MKDYNRDCKQYNEKPTVLLLNLVVIIEGQVVGTINVCFTCIRIRSLSTKQNSLSLLVITVTRFIVTTIISWLIELYIQNSDQDLFPQMKNSPDYKSGCLNVFIE